MRFFNLWQAERQLDLVEAAIASQPLFAIRHKPTGRFLPRPPSGQRGGTWVEPTTFAQPRFFPTERAAKGFLTVWLKGPLINIINFSNTFGIEDYGGVEHKSERAKEPRIRDEYEVVTIFWGVKK